jgi:hypothetical protein
MASGNLSLLISDDVSWETFPGLAQSFTDRFGGAVIKRIDSPVERIWTVTIQGCEFWLSFDDHSGMSLDSKSSDGNAVVKELYGALVSGDRSER